MGDRMLLARGYFDHLSKSANLATARRLEPQANAGGVDDHVVHTPISKAHPHLHRKGKGMRFSQR
jgi:hypothetical protein